MNATRHTFVHRTAAGSAAALLLAAVLTPFACAPPPPERPPPTGPGIISPPATEAPPPAPPQLEHMEVPPAPPPAPLFDVPPRAARPAPRDAESRAGQPAVIPTANSPPARQPEAPAAHPAAEPETEFNFREIFPHIRIDRDARIVEFDGAVAWDVHDPDTPMTFLEVMVCTPDTKEYEALVVTRARPSNVHAALLLLGLEPGKPGTFVWEDQQVRPVDPQGPAVDVQFILDRGTPQQRIVDPRTWIVNASDPAHHFGAPPTAAPPAPATAPTGQPANESVPPAPAAPRSATAAGWVFAGSRIVQRDFGDGRGPRDFYLADGDDGAVVGLTTFGSETIAWARTISPDSNIHEPEWIASVSAMPPLGTPVTVRIRPLTPAPAATATPAESSTAPPR